MTKINVNDISINYQMEGKGKTIVFIHGLSDSLQYWNILTLNLKNDYKVLSFDLRGHGETTDSNKITTIDTYTEDLYCLLNELKIEKAVFIGLSLGGNIAMNMAITHPEMVSGIIIMSSFPRHTPKLEKIFDDFQNAIDKGFIEFFDTILPYTITEDKIEESEETVEFYKLEAAKTANVEGISKGINAGYDFDISDKLSSIKVPALVIAGKEDDLTDLEIQEEIHDNIENSEMIIFEKTKHNILIGGNIEEILKIINEFMLKID